MDEMNLDSIMKPEDIARLKKGLHLAKLASDEYEASLIKITETIKKKFFKVSDNSNIKDEASTKKIVDTETCNSNNLTNITLSAGTHCLTKTKLQKLWKALGKQFYEDMQNHDREINNLIQTSNRLKQKFDIAIKKYHWELDRVYDIYPELFDDLDDM
jgi:predicted nucleic-acid-binding Zn-ribbon protein